MTIRNKNNSDNIPNNNEDKEYTAINDYVKSFDIETSHIPMSMLPPLRFVHPNLHGNSTITNSNNGNSNSNNSSGTKSDIRHINSDINNDIGSDGFNNTRPALRRRISISNGQISQLNDDLETVDNLYNTQPPPMPNQHAHTNNNDDSSGFLDTSQQFQDIIPTQININNNKNNNNDNNNNNDFSKNENKSIKDLNFDWKRNKLLERNRIAASKSRRRKKVQELELKNKFNELILENSSLKQRIIKYEKILSKYKSITNLHFDQDNINNNSSDNIIDRQDAIEHNKIYEKIKFLEEMLKIEYSVGEVNKYGTIITMDDDDPSIKSENNLP